MFDVGFSEIMLTVIVGCLVVDPKKLPRIIKEIRFYYQKFKAFRSEASSLVYKLDEFCDVEEKSINSVNKVIGDDGCTYEAYDIKSILEKREQD